MKELIELLKEYRKYLDRVQKELDDEYVENGKKRGELMPPPRLEVTLDGFLQWLIKEGK